MKCPFKGIGTRTVVSAIMLMSCSAFADTWTDPDTKLEWNYCLDYLGKEVYVLGRVGNPNQPPWIQSKVLSTISQSTEGAVNVPSVISGLPVTKIADIAFEDCTNLTSVTIPSSIVQIGGCAFAGCSSLKEIEVVPENKQFSSQDGVLFNKDKTQLIECPEGKSGSYELPSGVVSISEYAFSDCDKLESVIIPQGVKSIGDGAFYESRYLTSVKIPSSVTSIGASAFNICTRLRSLEFPAGVSCIDDETFAYCDSLESVVIPSSVVGIGTKAFYYCDSLRTVYVDKGDVTRVKTMLAGAGLDTTDISFVERDNPAAVHYSITYTDTKGAANLNPTTYTDASDVVFSSLEDVDGWKFVRWEPASIAKGTTGDLTVRAIWGSSSTAVGEWQDLKSGYSWLYTHFSVAGSFSHGVTLEGDEVELGDGEYRMSKKSQIAVSPAPSGEFVIPSNVDGYTVVSLGAGAFEGAAITSVVLPATLKYLGGFCLAGCKSLTTIEIPDGVVYIGQKAFDGNTVLQSVKMSSKVVVIDCAAFDGCVQLASIALPKSLREICQSAFSGCSALRTVYVDQGDEDRIKGLMETSGFDTSNVAFVENEVQAEDSLPVDPTPEKPNLGIVEEIAPVEVDDFAATTYDGYLCDEESGVIVGTIQVKAAKAKNDKKNGKTVTALTIAVQLADESKKISVKGNYDLDLVAEQAFAVKNRSNLVLLLGSNGLTGSFEGYVIEGVANVYSAKDAQSKEAASAADAAYVGSYNVIADEGLFAVTVAKKGKVKVTGTTSAGESVSVSTQLIVGQNVACVPVIAPKVGLSFAVWLGDTSSVNGLSNAIIGPAGTLRSGARFTLDASELADLVGDATYAEYFPTSVSVSQSGTKWIVAEGAKAGKVTLNKAKTGVDESKLGANPFALKLSYTAKTGAFKGSFKAYVNANGEPKALSVTVLGALINGNGYGTATIKKYGSVDIEIR